MEKRRNHIKAYHQNKLKDCEYCRKRYLDPWDFNTHLANKHVWCEPCQGYVENQRMYDAHYKAKHDPGSKMAEKEKEPRKEPTLEPQKEPTPEPQTDPELRY